MDWRNRLAGLAIAAALAVGALAWGPLPGAGGTPRTYTVDAEKSRVELLVFREGLFALLAHDHVMIAEKLSGRVRTDPDDLPGTTLSIRVPVDGLAVDAPEERSRLDLGGKLDKADRREIRNIMLSRRVLDASRHPQVRITLSGLRGGLPRPVLSLALTIRGVERVIEAPVTVSLNADVLEAEGEIEVTQSEFGIEPYSTLLGAIAVEDTLRVRFRIVAHAVQR